MENIREYIYLDIERIKSIFSQMEEGLIIQKNDESSNEKSVEGEVGSGILSEFLLNIRGDAKVLFSNKNEETKVLHDYMYNYIEKKMINKKQIKKIPEEYDEKKVHNELTPNSFVLLDCYIRFEDYSSMTNIINDFNDFIVALEIFGLNPFSSNSNVNQWEETEENLKNNSKLFDEAYINALSLFFKQLYNEKLIIKCIPFDEDIFSNFIGLIKKDCLRETIEDIFFKYGISPTVKWQVFGQISSIPRKNAQENIIFRDSKYNTVKENWDLISSILNESNTYKQLNKSSKEKWKELKLKKEDFIIFKGKVLELTFEQFFDSMHLISEITSVKYPSIKFTPIAIYRV